MNILFVTQYDLANPDYGGPVFKVRYLSNYLANLGHNVSVVTVDDGKDDVKHLQDLRDSLHDRVSTIRLKTLWRYRAITLNPSVFSVVQRQVPTADIIHIFGFYDLLSPFVVRSARIHNVPYIIEPIGMFTPIVRSLLKKKIYHRLLGRRLVSEAECIIATSTQEKEELVSNGLKSQHIVIRRNGIDLSEFSNLPEHGQMRSRLGIHPDERLLLYLSRLSSKKNPEMLMQVFAKLDLPKTKLVLAGPSESGYLEKLKLIRKELELENDIIFTGPLFGDEKMSALVDADIFVLPSTNENFGNVIAESVAAGTPVVITNKCGIAPYIKDRVGLTVSPKQQELQQAIVTLLSDTSLYKKFELACSDVAKEFSWDQPAASMEQLYKKILTSQLL